MSIVKKLRAFLKWLLDLPPPHRENHVSAEKKETNDPQHIGGVLS